MHTRVSNALSSISREECEAFVETLVASCFVELELNHECMKVVVEKNRETFLHIPDEPCKPRNFCRYHNHVILFQCMDAPDWTSHNNIMVSVLDHSVCLLDKF